MQVYLFFIFFIALFCTTVNMGAVRTFILEDHLNDVLSRRPDNAGCDNACCVLGYGGGQYQCCYENTASDGTTTYQPKCVCSG
uniref:Uncharacterized protein n=1 Tax=Panagrolaimus sp. ES5 TaxID=591445 RepID=A0AC34GAT7_9BILA